MTIRYSARDLWSFGSAEKQRLFHAQDGLCGLCGKVMLPAENVPPKNMDPTLDHVWPRHPAARDMATFKRLRGKRGTRGNAFLAHAGCNRRKGNRLPTGCELLTLAWVNARVGLGGGRLRPAIPLDRLIPVIP